MPPIETSSTPQPQHQTVVQVEMSRFRRSKDTDTDPNAITYAPQNDDDDDDVDGGSEALKRLLSPQGALVADLATEIVSRLTSEERASGLASMSRPRYVATQCITVFVAIAAVVCVFIVTFSNNDVLADMILRAFNQTLNSDDPPSEEEAERQPVTPFQHV